MGVTKVQLNGSTLIDLSEDTIEQDDVLLFKKFHDGTGTLQVGTASGTAPDPDIYTPHKDGKTYLYITLDEYTGLNVILAFSQNTANGVSITWGDNSAAETVSGTGNKTVSHTYASAGDYTIILNRVSGTLTLSSGILSQGLSSKKIASRMLNVIEIGTDATIGGNNIMTNCLNMRKAMFYASPGSYSGFFQNQCYSLELFDSTFTSIGSSMFIYCYSLRYVDVSNATSLGTSCFSACSNLTKVKLNDNLTTIPANCFQNCSNLTSVNIPSKLTSIEYNAFYTCYALYGNITLPSGLTSIGYQAFHTTGIESITLPSTCTEVGYSAFAYCRRLKSVDASGVISFTESTASTPVGGHFNNNGLLETLKLTSSASLTRIPNNFCASCYSLTDITIPSGVTSIGNYAFSNCWSIKSITIPAAVTTIGNYAFSTMTGCLEFHFLSTTPPTAGTTIFSSISFTSVGLDGVTYPRIYVPAASLNAYKGATNWASYANYMVGE